VRCPLGHAGNFMRECWQTSLFYRSTLIVRSLSIVEGISLHSKATNMFNVATIAAERYLLHPRMCAFPGPLPLGAVKQAPTALQESNSHFCVKCACGGPSCCTGAQSSHASPLVLVAGRNIKAATVM
jgi:hypothetical protein